MSSREASAESKTCCWVTSNMALCHSPPDPPEWSGYNPEPVAGIEVTSGSHINPATVFVFDEGEKEKP